MLNSQHAKNKSGTSSAEKRPKNWLEDGNPRKNNVENDTKQESSVSMHLELDVEDVPDSKVSSSSDTSFKMFDNSKSMLAWTSSLECSLKTVDD